MHGLAHHLLLVEDDREFADVFVKWIEPHFKTTVVHTLADAIKQIAEVPYWDAIILDMKLPNGEGIEVVEAIQRYASNVPIIAFTGSLPPDAWREAILAGAQEFCSKGDTTREQMLRSIRRAITRHQVRKEFRKLEKTAYDASESQKTMELVVGELKKTLP